MLHSPGPSKAAGIQAGRQVHHGRNHQQPEKIQLLTYRAEPVYVHALQRCHMRYREDAWHGLGLEICSIKRY